MKSGPEEMDRPAGTNIARAWAFSLSSKSQSASRGEPVGDATRTSIEHAIGLPWQMLRADFFSEVSR